ncbi:MAG: energy transducer TonB [Deltaproteobacteria bacterium]|nr:energy transducer TonB [Deltaproteobacteria bacterium]
MNRTILISGSLALAIHALLFTLPLSQTMRGAYAPMNPISISIIHNQETVAAVPQIEISAEAEVQPRFETRNQQAVISKKEIIPKKALADSTTVQQSRAEEVAIPEPVSSRENQEDTAEEVHLENMIEGQDKEVDDSPPGRTYSITSTGERQTGTPKGGRSGDDVIVDARPKYKENPLPHYPSVARRRGYEGRTVLRVEVLESGKVGQIELAASSGFEVLDKAALGSVKGWSFFPGTRNGGKEPYSGLWRRSGSF